MLTDFPSQMTPLSMTTSMSYAPPTKLMSTPSRRPGSTGPKFPRNTPFTPGSKTRLALHPKLSLLTMNTLEPTAKPNGEVQRSYPVENSPLMSWVQARTPPVLADGAGPNTEEGPTSSFALFLCTAPVNPPEELMAPSSMETYQCTNNTRNSSMTITMIETQELPFYKTLKQPSPPGSRKVTRSLSKGTSTFTSWTILLPPCLKNMTCTT